jgi:hypothetical protein
MKKIRLLYFEYIEKNTSAAWEAFANACHRSNLDPETVADSFNEQTLFF